MDRSVAEISAKAMAARLLPAIATVQD